jgi:hypothetical protein
MAKAEAEMTVYEELLAIAAMKAPKDPNEQVFLIKLFKAINDLPEDEWEGMSEAAQAWSNKAAKAKTADKAYPKVPGAEVEGDEPDADGDGAEGAEDGEAPVAKKAAKKAPAKKAAAPAKKAAPAPAKKAAAKKSKAGEKPVKSMAKASREIICKAPHLTVVEIITKLEAQGYEAAPVTISTFRSDTRAVLKIAQDLKIDLQKLDFDK